jgi:hypothetical protein
MEFKDRRSFAKKHTCWDNPQWDGQLTDGCEGCEQAEQYPCEYCGYGHAFTTHNPEAHGMNGDPLIHQMGESRWSKVFQDKPYIPA